MSGDSAGDLTQGSLARHLVRLTGPMVIGVLAVMSVGLADAYFIGQIGETELAAISFIFPVTTTLTSLGIGLAAGANALVSQALGRGETDNARRYAAQSIALSLLAGAGVSALGFVTWEPLFRLLQAEGEVLAAIGDYMRVWFLSFPLLMVLLVSNSTIRAYGNSLVPSSIMVLDAAFNIGLDPPLIFGWGPLPEMGIAGAAAATLVAFAVGCTAMSWPVLKSIIKARRTDFVCGGYRETGQGLARVGGPAALANALNPAGLAVITAIVSRFGPSAVAGFGVAGRIESFLIVPLLALSGSIGPIIGQNFGAEKINRAGAAMSLAAGFCTAYGIAVALVLLAIMQPLTNAFSESAAVQESAALYLRIVSWSFFAYGLLVIVNASLNARDKAGASMTLSLVRILLLYVPLALAGAEWMGESGVYGAAMVTNLIAGAAALVMARYFQILCLPWRQ